LLLVLEEVFGLFLLLLLVLGWLLLLLLLVLRGSTGVCIEEEEDG